MCRKASRARLASAAAAASFSTFRRNTEKHCAAQCLTMGPCPVRRSLKWHHKRRASVVPLASFLGGPARYRFSS